MIIEAAPPEEIREVEKKQPHKNVTSDSKRKYSGYFMGLKKEGKGREEDMQKQTIYEGFFKDDMYHGEGILYQELTKCYFKGTFEKNKKKAGIEIFPNGDIYEGEYQDDRFHGKGYLRNGDLFFYVEQPDLKLLPKGDYLKQQSTYSYQGDFYEGQRQGQGTEKYIRGTQYVGEFRHNQRHGKGRLTFPNQSYYEGDFVNGNLLWKNVFQKLNKLFQKYNK